MGKALFINIQGEYERLQCYVSNKNINIKEDSYVILINNLDIGDIVGVEGEMFYTKTNEYTLRSHNFILLSKSIRPLPNLKEKEGESFNSFDDKELRYRSRHLDLIANPKNKEIFVKRHLIVNSFRNYLNNNNFIEALNKGNGIPFIVLIVGSIHYPIFIDPLAAYVLAQYAISRGKFEE